MNGEGFSVSKIACKNLDVIGIYRSQEGNITILMNQLEALITEGRATIIGRDMNIYALGTLCLKLYGQ